MADLLAIDIGNTNIHLGLWHNRSWDHNWRAQTVHQRMPDEYAVLIDSFLKNGGFDWSSVSGVAIASVVPSMTTAFTELTRNYLHTDPLIVSARINTGNKVDVEIPDQVGADRIANAAAVNKLYGGPAIVVDFGTATNFDVVSREGNYIGGSIAPGVGVALDALVGRTAQLYKVSIEPPPSPIGRNTSQCIQSGVFWGYVGLFEGLIQRIRKELPGGDTAKVIATGGMAPLFKEHTVEIQEVAPFLTLDGIRVIYEMNQ
jgi:type III pantothenate kinase